jgi:hypothetical protein
MTSRRLLALHEPLFVGVGPGPAGRAAAGHAAGAERAKSATRAITGQIARKKWSERELLNEAYWKIRRPK